MNYFYDRALKQFVDASGSSRTLRSLRFMRDEDREMSINIQDNGTAWTANGTASVTFGIKQAPGETSDILAIIEPAGFTEVSDIYTGTLELNGDALSDLLGADFSLKLFCQLVITDDDGTQKSDVIPVIMGNDIIRGNEGTPSVLPNPDAYVRARAVVYDAAQTLTDPQKAQARTNIGVEALNQSTIEAAITDDAAFRTSIGAAPTVHTHEVGDITPISSGKLLGRHGGGSGAAQEVGLDGGLEFHGANIRREALTGDVTAAAGDNATTITNDAVTNAKLANMPTATIKGRTTAGTGDPEDLTAAQARTVLGLGNAATMTVDSDLPTLSLPANTTISAFGATLIDDADAATARTTLGLGTAATANTADLVSRSGGIFIPPTSNLYITGSLWNNSGTPVISNGIELFCFSGDSITDQGTTLADYNESGYQVWLRYLTECAFDFVPRLTSNYLNAPDYDFGYGSYSAANFLNGNRAGDGVYPMTDIATANPSVVFVHLGSNSGTSDVPNILAIWDQFIADGRLVIGAEILPRSSGALGYNADDLAACYAANVSLKAAAATRGILFAEWAFAVTETVGGYGSSLYLTDGVHPNIAGAARMADYLKTLLADYIPSPYALPGNGSADWVTSNPYMDGDVSGGATGFTFTGHTAKSKITDGDGTVWQRITSSQLFNQSDTLRQTSGTTTAVAGDIVRGVCRIRPVVSGWGITGMMLRVYANTGTTINVRNDFRNYVQSSGILFNPKSGLMMTPPYTVPSGTTGLFTYLQNFGSGTMDVRQLGVIKVG